MQSGNMELREQMNPFCHLASRNGRDCTGRSTPVGSTLVKVPRIAEAPVQLECKYVEITLIPGWDHGDGYKGYLEKSLVFTLMTP